MSERMTAKEITELRTLADNACGGPYAAVDNPLRLTLRLDVDEVLAHSRAVRADGCPSRIEMIPQGILHTPDAEYAAAAMQRVPRLLDEIEALQRELAEAQRSREEQKALLIICEQQLADARGAMAAQDERERQAAARCGVPYSDHGCDWPDAVAEALIAAKQDAADWKARAEKAEKLNHTWNVAASSMYAGSEYIDDPERVFAAVRKTQHSQMETIRRGVERAQKAEAQFAAAFGAAADLTSENGNLKAQLAEAQKDTERLRLVFSALNGMGLFADFVNKYHPTLQTSRRTATNEDWVSAIDKTLEATRG